MKKIIILMFVFASYLYSVEYDLDFFISRRINESIKADILEVKIARGENRDEYLVYGKYNDIKLTVNTWYRKDYLELRSEYIQNTFELKYGIFQYKMDYDWSKQKRTLNRIGLVKNLKEFTYDNYDYARDVQGVQKQLDIERQLLTRNNDIVKIIAKYGEIKKQEADLKVKVLLKQAIKTEFDRAIERLEKGEIELLEYELAQYRYDLIKLDIDRIKENIKNTKAELVTLSNLDLEGNFTLKEIPEEVELDYSLISINRINIAKLDIEKAKFQLKNEKVKDLPNIEFVSDYDFVRDGYRFGIRFFDTIEIHNGIYEDFKLLVKEKELELEKVINQKDTLVKTLEKEYARLLNQYSMRKLEAEYKTKEVKTLREMYLKGLVNFIDYTDKANELETSLVNLYKTEQDLLVFKHSIRFIQ